MAKKKNRVRKGKVPAHLKRYLFKKKRAGKKRAGKKRASYQTHHGEHMAKKKSRKRSGKRRGGARRSHRRHGHGGASLGSLAKQAVPVIIAGAAVGWIDNQLRKQDSEVSKVLSKLPRPVAQIGRIGNLALAAYLASYFVPGKYKHYAKTFANTAASITAYQIMAKGEAFKEGSDAFAISGLPYHGNEQILDGDDMGALEDEAHNLAGDDMSGWEGDFHLRHLPDDPVHAGNDEHHDDGHPAA